MTAGSIKLTVDHLKIDADQSDIPIVFNLTTSCGTGNYDATALFTELSTSANRKKIKVFKSDHSTQCYAEIELGYDFSAKKMVLHVLCSAVSSSVDEVFYINYDSTFADNTTYIGDTGDIPAQTVWDSNFEFVSHMADATTSTIADSTSNNNTGTKKAANVPVQIDGELGKGQDFGGVSDEHIEVPSIAFGLNDVTTEIFFKSDQYRTKKRTLVDFRADSLIDDGAGIIITTDGYVFAYALPSQNTITDIVASDDNNPHYVAVPFDQDGNFELFVDAVSKGTASRGTGSWDTHSIFIGDGVNATTSWKEFIGLIDEVRFSFCLRSDAWIKATNHSLKDDLLTLETCVPVQVHDLISINEYIALSLSNLSISKFDVITVLEYVKASNILSGIFVQDNITVVDYSVTLCKLAGVSVNDLIFVSESTDLIDFRIIGKLGILATVKKLEIFAEAA